MALLLPLTEIAVVPGAITAALRRNGGAGSGARRPRVCASGRVKDQEAAARVIRVSDPIQGSDSGISPFFGSLLLLGSSSSPPSPPIWQLQQQKSDGGDDKQKYYVNLGDAIRTLREELPDIFYKEPSFDIYRDDIVFKDPLNAFMGMESYRRIFWALRFNGRIFFKSLWVDMGTVWQPAENIIMIRWTVHGVPRVPWEARGRFDGTSEYKLDRSGKIYEHRVDNVAFNSPAKFRVMPVEELIRLLDCPSTPKPTYFETMLSSFTWIRCYLALRLTLALRFTAKG